MPLPELFRPFFWDCDFAALDADRDREFVIGRILASGTWDAIQATRQAWGDDELRAWILRHQGRPLGAEQIRLWELLLDLPAADVAAWLSQPERRIWEGSGAA